MWWQLSDHGEAWFTGILEKMHPFGPYIGDGPSGQTKGAFMRHTSSGAACTATDNSNCMFQGTYDTQLRKEVLPPSHDHYMYMLSLAH